MKQNIRKKYSLFSLEKVWSMFKRWKVNDILPQDWIIIEKSLATGEGIFNAKVITGYATAPPPSEVIPESLKIYFN